MRHLFIVLGVLLLLGVVLAGFAWVALQRVDWAQYKQPVEAAVLDATGRKLDLAGNLVVELGWRPGVQIEDVGFENAAWGSRPQMLQAKRLVVRLELMPLLFGDVVVDRLELVDLDVLLERRADGTPNWELAHGESASPREPEAEAASDVQPLSAWLREARIENAVIVVRDAAGVEQRFHVRRLVAQMDARAHLALQLEAAYGEAPVQVRGVISGVAELLANGPLDLDLQIEAGGAVADLSGRVAEPLEGAGLDLALKLAGDRLAGLAALLGTALPDLGPYSLALNLSGGSRNYAIRDFALGVGRSQITGSLDVDLARARPQIDASLASARIDTADFRDRSAEVAAEASSGVSSRGSPGRIFAADLLPVSELGMADVRLALAIDSLEAGRLVFSNTSLGLRLHDRRLEIDALHTEVAGGRVDLSLSFDAPRRPPSLRLAVEAEGVEAGQLASQLGSDLVTGGALDIDVRVHGRGASLQGIMASLEGTGKLEMGSAVIHHAAAGIVLSSAESALQNWLRGEGAEIACLLADFVITDGIARPGPLVADLGSVALIGTGKLDLRTEKIKLRFDPSARSGAASKLLPPFELKGTFADPRTRVDTVAVAGRAVAMLLGSKKHEMSPPPHGLGCRELYASHQSAQSLRGSTTEVALDTALGGLADRDNAAKVGKSFLKGVKGFLGR